MAEESQPPALTTAFPPPPPYWQSFTADNLDRISELRATQSGQNVKTFNPAKSLPVRLLELPPELRNLQPPEPPTDGKYRCFGDTYNLNEALPSLEDQNMRQLYSPPGSPSTNGKHANRAFILKRISKSLLLNFLELIGIMSLNAEIEVTQYDEKVSDLRTLFVNFHHLINEYRPHQARESLILMMQDQLDKSRAETDGIRKMKAKVEGILEGLSQAKLVETTDGKVDNGRDENIEEGRDVWDELEKEFG
ncbi:mediator complex, subunit Med7 [Tricladium varicosporioides]|nr:mediator complex, subunit Med7 [Hymenoscyphus varicosporioides]